MKNNSKFIQLKRVDAPKLELETRKSEFVEIYKPVTPEDTADQSERCLECGNPYCQWKCPVHNYIPQWLKLAYEGKIIEAATLSHQTNSFPEICGRVCPQDRLCEGSCTLNDGFGAVTIGNVEKYISDEAFKQGWRPHYNGITSNKKVAIIGAGPAGLSCADRLAIEGIQATVFDRQSHIGGLMTFGIPAFKLEKSIIANRLQILSDAGVIFKLGVSIGKDILLEELLNSYDAVFIGTGTYQPIKEATLNTHNINYIEAINYLASVNTDLINEKTPVLTEQIKDKNVLVLGGGDTTMDCIRTSIRLGAKTVTGAYRRDESRMPGSKREYNNSCEEGAKFVFNAQPIGLIINDNKLCGVRFIQTQMTTTATGRHILEHISGSEFDLNADIVITAFGFTAEALPWLNVDFKHNGCIVADALTTQTSNPKIFAGGDIVRGASLVVEAIADGMQAAAEIIKFLK